MLDFTPISNCVLLATAPHVCVAVFAFGALLFVGCSKKQKSVETVASVSFNKDVRPILTQNCTSCHGGVKEAGGVSFIYRDTALGLSAAGKQIIAPGDPGRSELIRRVTAQSPDEIMPPAAHGDPLSAQDIAILEQWISDGAVWEEHWSYVAPVEQAVPAVQLEDWPRGDIDRFVLAKMEEHGLSPNPEAEKPELLRRLTFDLIGLPPSVEELTRFEEDTSSEAYERVVDRLLASPQFGERWAVPWLDLARYADSSGYERDVHREIWGYRDWVVRSINEDMPFDHFTVAQLAGDQLDEPTRDELVATGFHRNTKTNVEGGTDDEEFRLVSVMDRVSTTWQAWMGTTFSCVQCHSHPYDPFPHESYYEFMAYFNNTEDHDLRDEYPTLQYAIEEESRARVFELDTGISEASSAYVGPLQDLSKSVAWESMKYLSATGTQGVVFSIERDAGGSEILQLGPNAPKGTIHTIVAKTALQTLQAIRIDAPMLEGATVDQPGDPFILSYIEATIKRKTGENDAILFERVVSDQMNPRLWPELSLDAENSSGWGAYPKQHYACWAVFVPRNSLSLAEGDTIEFVLRNEAGHDGAQMPVMRRFQFSLSDDPQWSAVSHSSEVLAAAEKRSALKEELAAIKTSSVPILRERPIGYERVTRVFDRGDWTVLGDRVQPNVPKLLRSGEEKNPSDRLEMADWIVSAENPLTARVAVNRYWEQLFGRGIVETLEDFGSPGIPPSHPKLLDYLALRFQGPLKWSRKALIRDIVLSAAYRQSPQIDAESLALDPRNTWLSRAPRKRLSAEMARDSALKISGLLSGKMYGPPVMPEQPEGVWRLVYNDMKWETPEGEDRYRRGLYTYWKRSSPYPSFITFDAPSRDVCTPRRISTNTPLQALVSLNDPVYLECAFELARRSFVEGGRGVDDWIRWAYRAAMLKEVSEKDLGALRTLYEDSLAAEDTAEEKAMAFVCSAVLNLDDYLTR